ncbi:MAG: phenylacetate-CoA oxygenase subunit PaaC [Acidothermus sp.]|nr:phenylacetate-CoA oxygenase subunit PaaC [Acidothermus sp.]MCL6537180.1 phenylacetate-CoA oxygenase subunit PaaC [Acidothermus sp.]
MNTGRLLFTYTLRLGDDALVLAQRLSEWASRAPEIEEDIALTNIALDLLGQARVLLDYAGKLEGAGRDEDDLAYLRTEQEYLNVHLVEQENGDFAHTIARQLFFSTYQLALYEELITSKDEVLAGVAAKGVKEAAYHRDHAQQWTLRLGDGTAESHRRMQAAVDRLWPFTPELFESDEVTRTLARRGLGVDPATLEPRWQDAVGEVLREATLRKPELVWASHGGRRGVHTECFGYLLAEMQYLHRLHPDASW